MIIIILPSIILVIVNISIYMLMKKVVDKLTATQNNHDEMLRAIMTQNKKIQKFYEFVHESIDGAGE